MYLCDGGPAVVRHTHVAAITPSSVISPNATSFLSFIDTPIELASTIIELSNSPMIEFAGLSASSHWLTAVCKIPVTPATGAFTVETPHGSSDLHLAPLVMYE